MAERLIRLGLIVFSLWMGVGAAWAAEPSGPVRIAGNGPEQPMIEELARAFERKYRLAYVDIFWHEFAKTLKMLRAGETDIAVTGKPEDDLQATQIAWDGIAVMVHISNTAKELTKQQIADIFAGKVRRWSQVGGSDEFVVVIDRTPNQNLRHAFLEQLGIKDIADPAEVIGPEQKAINKVVGVLPPRSAVTYLGLRPALKALDTGAQVRLLTVDLVEAEIPTVRDGRYPLRRPLLLLTRTGESNPTVQAFLEFAKSPEGQRILEAEGYVGVNEQ